MGSHGPLHPSSNGSFSRRDLNKDESTQTEPSTAKVPIGDPSDVLQRIEKISAFVLQSLQDLSTSITLQMQLPKVANEIVPIHDRAKSDAATIDDLNFLHGLVLSDMESIGDQDYNLATSRIMDSYVSGGTVAITTEDTIEDETSQAESADPDAAVMADSPSEVLDELDDDPEICFPNTNNTSLSQRKVLGISVSQPSMPNPKADILLPPTESKKLQHAIKELVDTEKSYLHRLRQMQKEFGIRLQAYCDIPGTHTIIPQSLVTSLFSTLDPIVRCHTILYMELKAIKSKASLIDALPALLGSLSGRIIEAYTPYAVNFASNPRLIQSLCASNPEFASFVKVSERCCGSKLESLRIEPIQRITRYILLIDAIRRYSPADARSVYDEIIEAFRGIAEYIDANMKVSQARMRVVEIQQNFFDDQVIPSLITSGRYCVRESTMKMSKPVKHWSGGTHRKNRVYSFILFNDIVVYSAITSELPKKGKLKGILDLNTIEVELVDTDTTATSFKISSRLDPSKESLVIEAKDAAQCKDWVHDLQICIGQGTDSARMKSNAIDTATQDRITGPTSPSQIELAKVLTRSSKMNVKS